ncbi:MAG: ATP-binding protein [Clostridia bacterium]|nr:ATP-binding protein [Clostridia bacterium]
MYDREVKERIKKINNTFRVLVVTGPRQVGKTTLLESMMPKNMTKVSLDDETLRKEAQENPKIFLDSYSTPLFIDEVQYAPQLFPYIKMKVDKNKERGQYWLSGSQLFDLMKNVTESLAGRAGIVKMNSFTYSEILQNSQKEIFDPQKLKQKEYIDVNKIFERIFNGGMPELYDIKDMDRNDFYYSYINTYIEKDIKKIKNIGNIESFKKFMRDIAIRTGTTLNYSDIANDVGVAVNTIKDWVSILVSTGIIYLLEPYSSNKLKRLTHMPKIIFMDSGLACYLANWENAKALQLSEISGHFFESYVVSELIKSYDNKGINLEISHFRNKETEEIDLILFKNNTLYPLEIKKTANPRKDMIKNFRHLEKVNMKLGNGGIICLYDKLMKLDDNNYIIPISSVIN